MPGKRPASEVKPNICVISDSEAGAYCTVVLGFGTSYTDIIVTDDK